MLAPVLASVLGWGSGAALLSSCSLDSLSREYGKTSPGGDSGGGGSAEGGAGFCATQAHVFCEDFDDGKWSGAWTDTQLGGGAGLRVDHGALLVSVPETTGDPRPTALLIKEFAAGPSTIDFSFAVNPDDLSGKTDKAHTVSLLVTRSDGGYEEARLVLGSSPVIKELDTDAQEEVVQGRDHALAGAPAPGRFSRVSLEVRLAPERRIVVHLDDAVVLDDALIAPWAVGPVRVQLGIAFAELPSLAYQLRFDDVAVDLR